MKINHWIDRKSSTINILIKDADRTMLIRTRNKEALTDQVLAWCIERFYER